MYHLRAALGRAFWSVYGRFVWDAQHTAQPNPLLARVVETLIAWCPTRGARVLDAGCGTGSYALALAQAGFRVTGVDYAPGMLARAQAKLKDAPPGSLIFQPASLDRALPYAEASFDYIINISVLQAVADPAYTLRELWRVLRPGGQLLLVHWPKAAQGRTWRTEVAARVARLARPSLWRKALVAAKCAGERAGGTRYWSAGKLRTMLWESGYALLSLDDGPPILAVAERPRA